LIESFVRNVRPETLPQGVSANDTAQPLIFNERGRPYERTNLYRRVVRILTAAGFADRASVQLLRHTYGNLAYKRTRGNLLFVQRQLGHAHPMVTAIYEQFVEFSYSGLADEVELTEGAAPQTKVTKRRRAKRDLQ
jgi:integrase